MDRLRKGIVFPVYIIATVQFIWCYLWLTRPYVNTLLFSEGRERMPFQGRCLMMPVMRWAHRSPGLHWLTRPFALSHFWFPRAVQPEVLVQAALGVFCVGLAGWFTVKVYQASTGRGLLTPFVYPMFLVVCTTTYLMHTVQNFRFIYDLPSLAFFSGALYLLYFRRHWAWFAALFLVGTVNRETTLMLLPLFAINEGFEEGSKDGDFSWTRALRIQVLALLVPLAGAWIGWELLVRHIFLHNASEFYPRFNWNIKSLLAPLAWPQLLSACGYLLLFVGIMRNRIPDRRLRGWLWIVPIWIAFMFSFGILVETRVFGELVSLVVCSTCLIAEEMIVTRMQRPSRAAPVTVMEAYPGRRPHRHSRVAS